MTQLIDATQAVTYNVPGLIKLTLVSVTPEGNELLSVGFLDPLDIRFVYLGYVESKLMTDPEVESRVQIKCTCIDTRMNRTIPVKEPPEEVVRRRERSVNFQSKLEKI